MADLATTLPQEVELGAVRRLGRGTQVVMQDSGHEVRNNRWANGLRIYEISFPISKRDDPVYQAVLALFEEAQGSLYSFNFIDWTDGARVTVRFDGELQVSSPATHLDQIGSLVLKEVREG
jgi:uncharacterized protein (TIGR02217 family)